MLGIEPQRALHVLEVPADAGDHHVASAKFCRRMSRFECPFHAGCLPSAVGLHQPRSFGRVTCRTNWDERLAAAETRTMTMTLPAALRREPHQLLFPLGVAITGIGVLPWIFFALGLTEVYRPIFHSVVFRSMFHPLAEIEGFLTCFAVGLIFTMLPR